MGIQLKPSKRLITYNNPRDDVEVDGDQTVSGTLVVTGAATFQAGMQSGAVAVTATVDGTGTGVIPAGARFVSVTSGNANHIARLPAPVIGTIIDGWVGATGFEVRSSVGTTINNVNGGDTNELAIPASTHFRATCVAANTWLVDAWNNLGADIAALVPDAV
jgi:hypothetical protein